MNRRSQECIARGWGSAAAGLAFDISSRGATASRAYRRMYTSFAIIGVNKWYTGLHHIILEYMH